MSDFQREIAYGVIGLSLFLLGKSIYQFDKSKNKNF